MHLPRHFNSFQICASESPIKFCHHEICVNLLIPIPSVILSNGFFSLHPSASSLVYITPLVTLLNKPEPGASIKKHLMFGFFPVGTRAKGFIDYFNNMIKLMEGKEIDLEKPGNNSHCPSCACSRYKCI
jgi:hypothetical protein